LKTLEISTRCGQDSDCNPSNALAVLGVIKGFKGLPADMQQGVKSMGDSLFIHTTYSFNTAVASTFRYANELITKNGGYVNDKNIMIKVQDPVAPELEVAFPDVVFDKSISAFEAGPWKIKGKWNVYEVSDRGNQVRKQAIWSDKAGDEIEISFNGTGISLTGNWFRDGGKADIYVDGILHRTIDTYYDFANQQHTESIWHVLHLAPGDHTVRLVVKGEKRPEANGSRVYITSATIFKTAPKKNEAFKFSFEK
jgi:hypothetical protein